jgi:hypothetical protein
MTGFWGEHILQALSVVRIVSNTLFCSLGPDDLTRYMLRPNNTNVIPTVTDNLFEQGMIGQKLIAVSFEPTTSLSARNGELTFGGVDDTKFTGEITYVYVRVCVATRRPLGLLCSYCLVQSHHNGSSFQILLGDQRVSPIR